MREVTSWTRRSILLGLGAGSIATLAACSSGESATSAPASSEAASAGASGNIDALVGAALTVSKSPTCGCCTIWVEYMTKQGVKVNVEHPADLAAVFAAHNIAEADQACHLTTTEDGHVFVGHLPATFMAEYLASPPEGSIGLVIPGMPVGTPGMESGDAFQPYDLLLLAKDGTTSKYRSIATAADQQ